MSGRRRVVITGIGCITPIGAGRKRFWEAALEGISACEPIPAHWRSFFTPGSTMWAPLPPIDFPAFGVTRLEQLQLDRVALIGIACAHEAITDAGLEVSLLDAKKNAFRIDGIDAERFGVTMGTGIGGISSVCANQAHHCGALPDKKLREIRSALSGVRNTEIRAGEMTMMIDELLAHIRLPVRFNPFTVAMTMPSSCSSSIGIRYGLRGQNLTCTAACAAGTVAIGSGYRQIADGACDGMIVGGAEYLDDGFGGCFRGFDIVGTLVKGNDQSTVNRPFDRKRTGFLFAEGGGAILVLEEREHARRRGARVYAELSGFAQTFDAHSVMAMEPSGRAAQRMIDSALAETGISGSDIDYVNTHGTGTVLNDETESALLERTFESPLVNSTKSLLGHTIGASGAIEAAVTALSIRDRITHVSKNIETPLRNLNFVRSAARAEIRHAITESFAFGGHNACLVLSRHDW